jgi:hypothetical protein
MAEKEAYFNHFVDVVMSQEGCNHIYTYLMYYEYPNGVWDPEGFPTSEEDKAQIVEVSKSLPVEFIDTWDWMKPNGLPYTQPIKAKDLQSNFSEWRRIHHPNRRADYTEMAFISEIKKSKDIEIRKVSNTNTYYSKTIDAKREEDANVKKILHQESEIKIILSNNKLSAQEKDKRIQQVRDGKDTLDSQVNI